MKFQGIKTVRATPYPNNYVVVRKYYKFLNIVIVNLILCLIAAAGILAVKYFGGSASEVLNAVAEALSGGLPV